MSINRVPAGVPTGGQFSEGRRGEQSTAVLDGDNDTSYAPFAYDELDTIERSAGRQGWGEVNTVRQEAPGVAFADCAGHGGFRLSKERNAVVPKPLRRTWYEEDCESYIVAMYHPDAYPHLQAQGQSDDEIRRMGAQGVADWYPDEYEQVTGESLARGDSRKRDEADYSREHANDWIVISRSSTSDRDTIEVGYSRGGSHRVDAERRTVRMSRAENDRLAQTEPFGKHRPSSQPLTDEQIGQYAVVPPPAPKPPKSRHRGIDTTRLTERQRQRAESELATRYRFGAVGSEGTARTMTLREAVEGGYVSGKDVVVSGPLGTTAYSMRIEGTPEGSGHAGDSYYSIPISKATWASLSAPDERTPLEKIGQAQQRAEGRAERATRAYDIEGARKARAEAKRLEQEWLAERNRKHAGE